MTDDTPLTGRPDTIRLSIGRSSVADLMGGTDEVLIFVNGNNLGNRLGGTMTGLPPEVVFSPSRHLLDRPHPLFTDNGKVAIYSAGGCGVNGFERILVKVTLEEDSVIWSDFEHQISLRPAGPQAGIKFVFDRKQYEGELSKAYDMEKSAYFDYIDR